MIAAGPEPIAVVGLACILPDARDPFEFWANLRAGRSSIREIPDGRWPEGDYYSPDPKAPDKTYSRLGSFVTHFEFDTRRFRIPPNVLRSMDVIQLWALQAAEQAFRDSGYDRRPFDRTRCAVILGNSKGGENQMGPVLRVYAPLLERALDASPSFARLAPDVQEQVKREAREHFTAPFPPITEDTMAGELSNVVAGRVANAFDLGGKNFTTDAACASSAAAIDAAIHALRTRECDLVLTGGVDRSQGPTTYVKFAKIGALSGRGSFPFDERADGFVMGEGCGMVLLKRLADAERDGDNIHAVIRGIGSSSDGKGRAITAPSIEGQIASIQRALADARLSPADIDYIECHGTGTLVGDVIEAKALATVFGNGNGRHGRLPIGSVKSNIGHLKSAAAIAGLLKAVLALRAKELPPSINFERPNPRIRIEETVLEVNAASRPWPPPSPSRPRRAGVSSFGFGGTNFHLIVEEYVPPSVPLAPPAALQADSNPEEAINVAALVRSVIAEFRPVPLIHGDADLQRDLGLTAVEILAVAATLRDRLNLPTSHRLRVDEMRCVDDLVSWAASGLRPA